MQFVIVKRFVIEELILSLNQVNKDINVVGGQRVTSQRYNMNDTHTQTDSITHSLVGVVDIPNARG